MVATLHHYAFPAMPALCLHLAAPHWAWHALTCLLPCIFYFAQPLVYCLLNKVAAGGTSWDKAADVLELAFQADPRALQLRCACSPAACSVGNACTRLGRAKWLGVGKEHQNQDISERSTGPWPPCRRLYGDPAGGMPLHHALSIRPAPTLDALKVLAPEASGREA